jgi:hypothetical protein
MHAIAVGSAYGEKQPAKAGVVALRCVVMHFEIHVVFAPTNFDKADPVPLSHFVIVLLWPGMTCACPGSAANPMPATVARRIDRTLTMAPSLLIVRVTTHMSP